MPPVLWVVLSALPNDASGVRDRAVLLVGLVGAFRRSELAAMEVDHLAPHPKGRLCEHAASSLGLPGDACDVQGEQDPDARGPSR